MAREKIVAGIDIGTSKISVLVGKENDYGQLDILGVSTVASQGVVRGAITNVDKTATAIERAVQEAEQSSGIDIQVVSVTISARHIESTTHRGSITRESAESEITSADVSRLTYDMHKIIVGPGNEIVHVLPQDYIVDYEEGIRDPVGMAGIKLEGNFHLITAKTATINNVHKCVHRAGLVLDRLMLEPLASSTAVLSREEKEAGVCLVDIGGGTVDVVVFQHGSICHTAIVPFGSEAVTADIRSGFTILDHQADLLKRRFARAVSDPERSGQCIAVPGLKTRPEKEINAYDLDRIVEARMSEIFDLVYANLAPTGILKKLIAGVVLTGGGAQLPRTTALAEYVLGVDARIGYPNEHVGKSYTEAVKSPAHAAGVGLLLAGGISPLDVRETEGIASNATKVRSTPVRKEKQPADLLKRLWQKTKGLLIDENAP